MDLSLDCKIRNLADGGWSPDNIARALGCNKVVVQRKLTSLGITASKENTTIYGLTASSYLIRAELGAIITRMNDTMSYEEISQATGLNRRQITHAMIGPYNYDWTLTQIERTLAHEGKTIYDITR